MFETLVYYSVCFVTLILLMFACGYDYKKGNPFFIVWVGIVMAFSIPSFFDYDGKIVRINDDAASYILSWGGMFKAHFFSWGFVTIYLFSRKIIQDSLQLHAVYYPKIKVNFFPINKVRLLLFFSLVAMVMAIYSIVSVGGINALLTVNYSRFRGETNVLFKMMSYYILTAVSGGALICFYKRKYVNVLLFLLPVTVIFFLSKTRQLLLPLLMPFVFYYLLSMRNRWKFFGIFLGAILGYLLLLFLQILRYQGDVEQTLFALVDPQFYKQYFMAVAAFKGEALLRYPFYFFMDKDNYPQGFGEGRTYIRLLMLLLPSKLSMGMKPRDFDEELYSSYYIYDDALYGTLHITLMGSSFVNFSWFGVFLGTFWAFFSSCWQYILWTVSPIRKILLLAPMGLAFLLISRGSVYNSVALLFYCSVFIWGITLHLNKFKRGVSL